MNETLNLIEEYQFIYEEKESKRATEEAETCLTYGHNGITVSANWLFKRLGRPERQKEVVPVLVTNNRLKPRIDIKELTKTYGVYDYQLSRTAAERVVINHDNYYVACDVLEELRDRYNNFRAGLIESGYQNI